MACHHRGPDRGRRYLRHELQVHSRTAMGVQLFRCHGRDADRVRGAVLAIPAGGMAVSLRVTSSLGAADRFSLAPLAGGGSGRGGLSPDRAPGWAPSPAAFGFGPPPPDA